MAGITCPFLDKFANGHHDGGAPDKILPTLSGECKKILQSNMVLAPTGCTAEFCQAGRMIHSDEPRIGESRPLDIVKKEADAFLWQLWQEGVYTESQYRQRYGEVHNSLEASAAYETVWINGSKMVARTAVWTQTSEELLHGLRLSWKNSRKCIMRSHYRELE
jgi:nitric oxide synthase oxygenase subunit